MGRGDAGATGASVDTTVRLPVVGMTCASCVARVERALATVPGVASASVNLATGIATVRHAGGDVAEHDLAAAIDEAGFEAGAALTDDRARAPGRVDTDREQRTLARDLAVATLLALPVVVAEMGAHLVPGLHAVLADTIGIGRLWVAEAVLTSLALAGPGRRFLRKGVPALVAGHPDMNSLVALGTGAAFGYSLVATFAPSLLPVGSAQVYFEPAIVIVVLILLGRYLEARAKGRTGDAIQRLLALGPKVAHVMRDGVETDVALGDLRPGDVVRVRPGESVATDGTIVSGSSYLDESMVTGEPVPVARRAGGSVIGGTLNTTGSFDFRVTGVGADTLLARIVRSVEDAQGAKLPIQAVLDRVTGWFVPAVMAAAATTFIAWLVLGPSPALSFAIVNAVAVLIIACPCAMGLATPTSIMVGTGRAAQLGILFRRGDALQLLRSVAVVALDKTGTLTEGRPTLTDLQPAPGFDENDTLALAAALEGRSEHPLAGAVVAAAIGRGLRLAAVESFAAVPGCGVSGQIGGRAVAVGGARHMAALGIAVDSVGEAAERLAAQARSPLYMAVDGRLAAIAAVSDPIRSGSADAVAALKRLGLTLAMVTGDDRRTADAVARRLGIDVVVAGVLPDGKAAALRELRAGRTIAFVGDGINDAPALAEADVGIAIGTGTDIAIETADVVLMSGDLRGVVNAVTISRAVLRNIHQNLFWAFAYNVALIPVAAGILYPLNGALLSPVLAAGAMAASSVLVLANALRLRRAAAADPADQPEMPRERTAARVAPAE